MAVDAAIKFWDRTLMEILLKKQKKDLSKATYTYNAPLKQNHQKGNRKEESDHYNRKFKSERPQKQAFHRQYRQERWQLPSPPPKRHYNR